LCGGREGVSEQLREVCLEKFGNTNISGTYTPPFREMTEEELMELANRINRAGTDVLWIGLSTPKQEKFAARIAQYARVHYIATVVAAFDFHIGRIKEAPKIMRQIGLEWLFRLCSEPRRLYRRYIKVVPLYIYYNLAEFFLFITDSVDRPKCC